MFETPVVMLAFNRPALTAKVFESVKAIRPKELFLIADGPRTGNEDDAARCAEVREIVTRVDWPATVQTNFSSENLGCGSRISSGLSWVFEHVEEAIILEDDCLPTPGFFQFCAELLEHYRENERVGIISGNHFMPPSAPAPGSYYFSRYVHIWGWATWRRSWEKYDYRMGQLADAERSDFLYRHFENEHVARYWDSTFETIANGEVDTWDYQLSFASFLNSWLNVMPARNLVSNLGFGQDATHTHKADHKLSNMATWEPRFPLEHPEMPSRWEAADSFVEEQVYKLYPKRKPLKKRIKHALKSYREARSA